MDRAPTTISYLQAMSYLQAVEARVANGKEDIADQHDLISTLERTGHAATSARIRLREMERAQARRIVERDRLRAELEVLDAAQLGNRRRIRRTP
jgi:cell division septum initiation protein DivIVA